MAGVKITDLNPLGTTPADDDVLIIVDTDEDQTKQISVSNLFSTALSIASAEQITVYDSETDALFYPLFAPSTNGGQTVHADPDLNYNPLANIFTAPFFQGDGSFLTGVKADSAANATFALTSGDALANIYDSGSGVRITGDTRIDSNLSVGGNVTIDGIFSGDGSGLTNIPAEALNSKASELKTSVLNDSSGLHYLILRSTPTGFDSANTTSYLTYDPQTFTLSALNFSGDGSNLTNVTAITATNATNVAVTSVSDSAQYYVHLGSTSSGNDNTSVHTGLSYNPFRGKLSTTRFSTENWEMFESANELFFAYNGVKKAKIDASGNVSITGTLTESASL